MYCRCTECGTGFALNAAQLRAGRGRVRCGTCLAVFDALQTLSDEFQPEPPPPVTDERTGAAGAPPERASIEAAVERADAADAGDAPADRPDVADADPAPPAGPVWTPLTAESRPLPGVDEPSTPTPTPVPAPAPTPTPTSSASQPEPSPTAAPSWPTPPRTSSPGIAPHAEDMEQSVAALRIVPVELDAATPERERPEPGVGATSPTDGPAGGGGESSDDEVPEVLREDMARLAASRRARRAAVGFGLGCLLLTAGLLLQWAWFQPQDVLARYPQARPWLEQLCERTGCVLPDRRDPSRVRMVTRDVRVHPRYEGALRVTASLMNTAPYTQPYPRLHFTLFNVNGQVIASRVFEPAQYLPGDVDAAAEMRPRVPVQVALELIAPEDAAVSFEFDFL